MTTTKPCRYCGAEFTKSRTDATVHCPAHRDPAARRVRKARALYVPAVPGARCTIGPRATDGGRCGAPAIVTLTGTEYHECAAHAPASAL